MTLNFNVISSFPNAFFPLCRLNLQIILLLWNKSSPTLSKSIQNCLLSISDLTCGWILVWTYTRGSNSRAKFHINQIYSSTWYFPEELHWRSFNLFKEHRGWSEGLATPNCVSTFSRNHLCFLYSSITFLRRLPCFLRWGFKPS